MLNPCLTFQTAVHFATGEHCKTQAFIVYLQVEEQSGVFLPLQAVMSVLCVLEGTID